MQEGEGGMSTEMGLCGAATQRSVGVDNGVNIAEPKQKQHTMCRTGPQVETEQQGVNEAKGKEINAPPSGQVHITPHRNHLWGITRDACNTIYSHMAPRWPSDCSYR